MREARKNRGFVRFRLSEQCVLKMTDSVDDFENLVAQIETGVERDLIVSAACAVDACAFIAEQPDEFRFDVHVNVFEGNVEFDFSLFDHFPDFIEPGDDVFGGFFRDNTGCAEHGCMSFAAHYVMLIEPFVKRDRFGEILHAFCRALRKSSAPQCHIQNSLNLLLFKI